MLSLLLALQLAAAPARPIAPKAATFAIQVAEPQSGLPELRGFLTQAGMYSALLKPADLGRTLGAMLGADLLDPASLAEAGIDVTAPLTVSFLAEATVVCAVPAKGGKALERARAALTGAGQPAKQAFKGVTLEGASAGPIWKAGFASKPSVLCVASGGSDALAALKGAVDAMAGAGLAAGPAGKAATGLKAPVLAYFQHQGAGGAAEVRAVNGSLKVAGRLQGPAWLDKPRDADLLATFAPEAPLSARATLTPKALTDPLGPASQTLSTLLASACKGCDAALARSLLDSLRPQLTGTIGVVVKGLDPTAAIEPMAAFFMVPHAYLLPLKDAELGKKTLEAAIEKLKARGAQVLPVESPEGAQWAISLGARDVRIGVARGALFVANDSGARDLALASLAAPQPGKPAHAASFSLDGPLATSALRRISVLDVSKSQELAALFVVGVELGSLLRAAGPITGFVDPEAGGVLFEAGLELKPLPPGPGAKP